MCASRTRLRAVPATTPTAQSPATIGRQGSSRSLAGWDGAEPDVGKDASAGARSAGAGRQDRQRERSDAGGPTRSLKSRQEQAAERGGAAGERQRRGSEDGERDHAVERGAKERGEDRLGRHPCLPFERSFRTSRSRSASSDSETSSDSERYATNGETDPARVVSTNDRTTPLRSSSAPSRD